MTISNRDQMRITGLLDHTQLPESDGTFVNNFAENERQRAEWAESELE